MSHDPLCPRRDSPRWDDLCPHCDLIANVRRDEYVKAYRKGYNERGRADAKSEAMFGKWNYDPQTRDNRP